MIEHRCVNCGSSEQDFLFNISEGNSRFPIVQCKCGMIFMNPRPRSEYLEDYYDKDYFDGDKKDFTSWQKFPEDLKSKVIDLPMVDIQKKGRFLDIGCGIGVYVAFMKELGWEAKGLDISQFSTDLGKKEGLDLFCGTLEEADYPDDYFDMIYMRDVIEHLSEPDKLLKEVRRILKNNGWFFLTTGNAGSIVARLRQEQWFFFQKDHIHYFSLKTLKDMVERSGMRIVRLGPEYCYGRSVSELKERRAPRMMIRIPEYIVSTKIAPALFKYFGATLAEPFAVTLVLHIKKNV